jgi:hypothetical protein
MVTHAYLPEIPARVGQNRMMSFASRFVMAQYTLEFAFMVLIIGLSSILNTSTVVTAQISQGVLVAGHLIFIGMAWFKYLPKVKAKRKLRGSSLYAIGFSQL